KLEDIRDGWGPLPQEPVEALRPLDARAEEPATGAAGVEHADTQEDGMSENQRTILAQMGREPADVDALVERTSLPAQVIFQEMTLLSLRGCIRRVDGQTYARR